MSNFKLKSPQKASNLHAYWGAAASPTDLPNLATDEQFMAQSGVLSHSFSFPATFDYANIGSTIGTQVKTSSNNEVLAETTTPIEKRLIDVADTPINRSEAEYLAALYRINSGSSLGFLLEDDAYPGAIARFDGELSLSTSVGGDHESFQLDRCVIKVTGADDLTASRPWISAIPFPSSGEFRLGCVYNPKDDDIDLSAIASVVQHTSGNYSIVTSTDSEFLTESDLFSASGSANSVCQVKDKLYVGFLGGDGDVVEYAPNQSKKKITKIHPVTDSKRHWQLVQFKNILISASEDVNNTGSISYYTGAEWRHSFISPSFVARCAVVDGDWLYCGGKENDGGVLYRTRDLNHWELVLENQDILIIGLYCDRNDFYLFTLLSPASVGVFKFDGQSTTTLTSVNLAAANSTITTTKFRGAVYFGASRRAIFSHLELSDLFRIQNDVVSQAAPEVTAIGNVNPGVNSLLVYRDYLFLVGDNLKSLYCHSASKDIVTAFSHLFAIQNKVKTRKFYRVIVTINRPAPDVNFVADFNLYGEIESVYLDRFSPTQFVLYALAHGGFNSGYTENLRLDSIASLGSNTALKIDDISITLISETPASDSASTLVGFTDFDRPLKYGQVYQSKYGASLSALDYSIDLNVDSSEIKLFAADNNDYWSIKNLKKGLFVNLDCSVDVVNRFSFSAPVRRNKLFIGQIGEIKIDDVEVTLELRSHLQKLQQKSIKKTSSLCPYLFGDNSCRKSLTNLTLNTNITESLSLTQFKVAPNSLLLKDGEVKFLSGNNESAIAVIQSFENNIITLWQPLPFLASVGDSIRLTAGCDKTIQTCGQTYSNQLNFGGFPWVMGKDQYMAGSNRSVSV